MKAENKPIQKSSLEWMPKSVWGPLLWKQLHCRALAYLPMDHEKEWLEEFIDSIPCPLCQGHFNLFMKDCPPDLTSRATFFSWSVSAHNFVNRSNNKDEVSIQDALSMNAEMFTVDKK